MPKLAKGLACISGSCCICFASSAGSSDLRFSLRAGKSTHSDALSELSSIIAFLHPATAAKGLSRYQPAANAVIQPAPMPTAAMRFISWTFLAQFLAQQSGCRLFLLYFYSHEDSVLVPRSSSFNRLSCSRICRHPAAEFEDVTRRQGCASRCGRCADTGPGARVIIAFLAAAGMCGIGSSRTASSRGCGSSALWGLPDTPRSGCSGCVPGT